MMEPEREPEPEPEPERVERSSEVVVRVTPLAEGPGAFAAFIRAELAKWREVAKRGDVVLD